MSSIQPLKELFVISDLHIGGALPTQQGERGFRINTHVLELALFVRELAVRHRSLGTSVELVINGDFVDFLAEVSAGDKHHSAFVGDATKAVATFDAIAARDPDLFDALAELVASGCTVTLLLGNHDVELSLPAVRQRLMSRLGIKANAGFRFVYDGEAYVVGDVLIEHGNRYDGWNVVDHDRLRRFRSESSRGLAISSEAQFFAPAGSELVQRVMNPIKQDYPFIDLLKPETGAALPLLLALEPGLGSAANGVEALRLLRDADQHQPRAPARPARSGDIAGGGKIAYPALWALLLEQLGPAGAAATMDLVAQAELAQIQQRGQIASGAFSRALSFMRLRAAPSYEQRLSVLLDALRALHDDTSFKRDKEGEACYLEAAQALAKGPYSTIVFGHTHLAKQVTLPVSGATYINTGTWADLMRIPDSVLSGPMWAAQVHLEAFANAILERRYDEFLIWHPTFAHIALDAKGHAVSPALHDYRPGIVSAL